MAKEVKGCARGDTCDRTLPADSKHVLCTRCRAHDRKIADRDPQWLRDRLTSCARWSVGYGQHLPKKERDNVVIEYVPNHSRNDITPIRKRA